MASVSFAAARAVRPGRRSNGEQGWTGAEGNATMILASWSHADRATRRSQRRLRLSPLPRGLG
jgi:hypothetical protein